VWLTNAPREELEALFDNPMIDDDFLHGILERADPWNSLSDERIVTIVRILGGNERMWTRNEDPWDGFADARYNAVFDSAWKLAENVEPTGSWAKALSHLYDRLEPSAFSVKDPLRFIARWRIDPSNAKMVEKEAKDNVRGSLSDYQGIRKGLARLALRMNSELISCLLTSPDIGMRSAAYSDGCLTPEQLLAGHQHDGRLVFEQAKDNLQLWRNSECREVLHRIAWAEDSPDWYPGLYKSLYTKIAKEHPDWFGKSRNLHT
jgi:hypothetical protein